MQKVTTKQEVVELKATVSSMEQSLSQIMAALGIQPQGVTVVSQPKAEPAPEIPLPIIMNEVKKVHQVKGFKIETVAAPTPAPKSKIPDTPAAPTAEQFTKERLTISGKIVEYPADEKHKVASRYMEFYFNGKPEEKLRKDMSAHGMRFRGQSGKWSGKISEKLTVEWAQAFGTEITHKKYMVVATKKAQKA